jgi:uncharacterized protein YicC (UPF0701 family)
MNDELDDAIAQVKRELEKAREEQRKRRGAELEEALAGKLAAIQAKTLEARARATELDEALKPLRDEEFNLKAKLDPPDPQ